MKWTMLARYGAMRTIGTFATDIKNLRMGDKCILRTDRGTELGEIVSKVEQTEDGSTPPRAIGMVLRRATPADFERVKQIEEVEEAREFAFCAAKIAERALPMRLVSVEHIFGGEKIIFYFLADGRVDFRQLVKDLATEYRTRIELRQIGVRDEARLLAEYEHCGRELCCRTFIKDLQPVTMRMAKLQKSTLDPTKISGRCGRLMCCLRYEDDTYSELKRELPKKGTRVRTAEGTGEVVGSELLAQTVTIEFEDRTTIKVPVSKILEVLPETTARKAEQREVEPESEEDVPAESPQPSRRRQRARNAGRPGTEPQAETGEAASSAVGTTNAAPQDAEEPSTPDPPDLKDFDEASATPPVEPTADEWWEDPEQPED